ncbi:SH3 domain-containing protein [Caryophanon latum]|uniref:SH3b domain-containing protein n=1 Tax=Caryophanon latum TaxID=33977 RepID=A0A1C0YB34_9BACL|nr:dynamin family protein [Caryophanon latum]OCS84350.1 hypothetical protein A6K76_15705 [Caryophanon latum]
MNIYMNIDILQQLHQLVASTPQLQHFEHRIQQLLDFHNDNVRILVMGEFSAGKSSLINALLERPILPTGAVATTAITTFLRYSEQDEYFEAVYSNGDITRHALTQLAVFSSERETSTVRSGLQYVNVYVNAPILKNMTLIDTPGLNSLNDDHTEQAMNVYKAADDGIWIFNFGKIGTSSEMTELKKLLKLQLHPLGVINMIDLSDSDDLTDLYSLTKQKLEGAVRDVIGVSALEAIDAIADQDDELLQLSNINVLKNNLASIQVDPSKRYISLTPAFEALRESISEELSNLLTSYEHKLNNSINYPTRNTQKKHDEEFEKQQKFVSKLFTKKTNINKWSQSYWQKAIGQDIPDAHWKELLRFSPELKRNIQYFNERTLSYNEHFYKKTNVLLGTRVLMTKNELVEVNDKFTALKKAEQTLKKQISETTDTFVKVLLPLIQVNMLLDQLLPITSSSVVFKRVKQRLTIQQNIIEDHSVQIIQPIEGKYLKSYRVPTFLSLAATTLLCIGATVNSLQNENSALSQMINDDSQYDYDKNDSYYDTTEYSYNDEDKSYVYNDDNYSATSSSQTTTNSSIIYPVTNHSSSLGYVTPSHDRVPVFSHPDADGTPIGYLRAGEAYDILAVSERLRMKLGEDQWIVYNKSDVSFNQQELNARLQTNATPLQPATVTSHNVAIFSQPSRSSAMIGYLENKSTVSIYDTASGDWVDIGNGAWVESDKHLSISWPYTGKNSLPNPIGEAIIKTDDFLNVRASTNVNGQVLGRLLNGERVNVYAVDNATGWLKVGSNAWISGDKKYVTYTKYAVASPTPKQTTVPQTTSTPTPQSSAPQQNNVVQQKPPAQTSSEVTETVEAETIEIEETAPLEAIGEVTVITKEFINVRNAPNQTGDIIGTLDQYEYVEFYDVNNSSGWLQIGENEWISGDEAFVTYTFY